MGRHWSFTLTYMTWAASKPCPSPQTASAKLLLVILPARTINSMPFKCDNIYFETKHYGPQGPQPYVPRGAHYRERGPAPSELELGWPVATQACLGG